MNSFTIPTLSGHLAPLADEDVLETGVVGRMKTMADAYGLWAEVKDAYDGYRRAATGLNRPRGARCTTGICWHEMDSEQPSGRGSSAAG